MLVMHCIGWKRGKGAISQGHEASGGKSRPRLKNLSDLMLEYLNIGNPYAVAQADQSCPTGHALCLAIFHWAATGWPRHSDPSEIQEFCKDNAPKRWLRRRSALMPQNVPEAQRRKVVVECSTCMYAC